MKYKFAFAAMVLAFGLTGVAHGQEIFRVGIASPESAQNPFYGLLADAAVAALKERGIESILLSADSDVNVQVNNINDLVAAEVDAILVSPIDTEGPASAIVMAKEAGIPIFMVARALDPKFGQIQESFLGLHFDAIGEAKAKWIIDHTEPGKVAMLLGVAGALVMVEQEQAFRKVLEEAGYDIAFAQNSTFNRNNGLKLIEDALIAHPDLVAIYAANDDLALGAAQAVRSAGLEDSIAVIGLNGIPPALEAIEKGELSATVKLDPVGWGAAAGTMIADFLIDGKKPEQNVPFQFEIVDQANVSHFIAESADASSK